MADDETAFPDVPADLHARSQRWADLKRWERRELGEDLRRLGLSYREISEVIPVSKGTLSEWCKDIRLTDEQDARLRAKRPAAAVRRAIGARRRQQALEQRSSLVASARAEGYGLLGDPFWVGGVVAYWSEGAKRSSGLEMSNSDPDLVSAFHCLAYLDIGIDRLAVQMHLHSGQDESERRMYLVGRARHPP